MTAAVGLARPAGVDVKRVVGIGEPGAPAATRAGRIEVNGPAGGHYTGDASLAVALNIVVFRRTAVGDGHHDDASRNP